MWETSKTPAAVRVVLCSSTIDLYCTGISQPAKSTSRAPWAACQACSGVRRSPAVIGEKFLKCKSVEFAPASSAGPQVVAKFLCPPSADAGMSRSNRRDVLYRAISRIPGDGQHPRRCSLHGLQRPFEHDAQAGEQDRGGGGNEKGPLHRRLLGIGPNQNRNGGPADAADAEEDPHHAAVQARLDVRKQNGNQRRHRDQREPNTLTRPPTFASSILSFVASGTFTLPSSAWHIPATTKAATCINVSMGSMGRVSERERKRI